VRLTGGAVQECKESKIAALVGYYQTLRDRQAEVWRQSTHVYSVLVLWVGALAYLISSASEGFLLELAALALPPVFALIFLQLLAAWYENVFLSSELYRVEKKVNELCGDTCLNLDRLWIPYHQSVINSLISPVYARGTLFLLFVFILFWISLYWSWTVTQEHLRLGVYATATLSLLTFLASFVGYIRVNAIFLRSVIGESKE